MLVHFLIGCACITGGVLLSFLICVDFGKRGVQLGVVLAVALLVLLTVLGTAPHALALAGVLLGLFYRHGRSSGCSGGACGSGGCASASGACCSGDGA